MTSQKGLTLLEVAIILIVLGLFVTPLLAFFNVHLKQQERIASDGNILVIQTALQKFALREGRYPIPAVRNVGPGDLGFGQEFTGTINNCFIGATDPCRSIGTRDTAADSELPPVADPVFVGDVPFAALGLPANFILDGFNSRFTYAVSAYLTDRLTFADDRGVIGLIDADFGPHEGTSNNIHYVVVSHGQNRKGAFNLSGIMQDPCTTVDRDYLNCNRTFNSVFMSNFDWVPIGDPPVLKYARIQSDAPGFDRYDDYIRYAVSTATDIWSRTPNPLVSDIYNRNAGMVLIGATIPPGQNPQTKVDVWGEVTAGQLHTNRLCVYGSCDAAGVPTGLVNPGAWVPRVFTPAIIGGNTNTNNAGKKGGGILCDGRGLTGISEADEECKYNSFPLALDIGDCAPGTFARGTDAIGKLWCVPPP